MDVNSLREAAKASWPYYSPEYPQQRNEGDPNLIELIERRYKSVQDEQARRRQLYSENLIFSRLPQKMVGACIET